MRCAVCHICVSPEFVNKKALLKQRPSVADWLALGLLTQTETPDSQSVVKAREGRTLQRDTDYLLCGVGEGIDSERPLL